MSAVPEQVWSVVDIVVKPPSSKDPNFIEVGFYRAGEGSFNAPDMNSGSIRGLEL